MHPNLTSFLRREDGAVTIDWVVLTATLLGLGIGVLTLVGGATDDLATELNSRVEGVNVGSSGGQ